MLIVGELINASRKSIAEAIKAGDAEVVGKVAKEQRECGAHYIDVNAGVFVDEEADYLKWLVTTVQAATDAPCCIDSPSPEAVEAALSVHKGVPMINSISLEKERYDKMLPMVAGADSKVVALCMSDKGMPETTDDRLTVADKLVNALVKNNVDVGNIYVDPLVQPLSTRDSYGMDFLNSVEKIMEKFPGVHTICGLSNISYGLPERKLLNRVFMVMAITKGLDSAVIDPTDRKMTTAIVAAEALAGRDEFCSELIDAYRSGRLEA